jgi:hypothetical protein
LVFRLARTIGRSQECRVRDIADQQFGLGHESGICGFTAKHL